MNSRSLLNSAVVRYATALVAVAGITLLLIQFRPQINSTTVALVLLLVILLIASFFGRNPALLASIAAMLCLNYFFLPPFGTFTISDTENLVAWGAFTITAVVAGELSAYARRRARESERLFGELQAAFYERSKTEALRQSERLKSALLDAVTHDLRTPLTSIKAAVTTLLEENGSSKDEDDTPPILDNETRSEFFDIINEETDRLNEFIGGMVDLARIQAGDMSSGGKIDGIKSRRRASGICPQTRNHSRHLRSIRRLTLGDHLEGLGY